MSFCSLDPGNNGFFVLRMSSTDDHQYLTEEAISELVEKLTEVHRNQEVKGLVITCESGAFCDGLDYTEASPEQAAVLASKMGEVIRLLMELPVPTVAAVCGDATSLGLALALAHDHCVLWGNAVLRLPEAELGRPLPGYVAALLREKLASAPLRKLLMLMSRRCTGQELAGTWYSAHGADADMQLALKQAIDLLYEIEGAGRTYARPRGANYAKARQTMYPETCAAVGIIPHHRPRPSPYQLESAKNKVRTKSTDQAHDNKSFQVYESLEWNNSRKSA